MSYILDALRRAEAERRRGDVPGLHAAGLPADAEPAARDRRPVLWAAGGAGAAAALAVVLFAIAPWRPDAAPPAGASFSPTPEPSRENRIDERSTLAQGETPPTRPGALAPAALPVEPPMDARAARPAPAVPEAVSASSPAFVPAFASAPGLPPRLAVRAAEGRVAVLERRAGPASAPSPNPAPVRLDDLSPALRAELPHLAVGGSIYSDSPSQRMVILNGQVFHEGDKPAADTVVEQIRLKSAVLSYRGQRYEITF
jgi:general secretion pathway protein B